MFMCHCVEEKHHATGTMRWALRCLTIQKESMHQGQVPLFETMDLWPEALCVKEILMLESVLIK